MGRGNSEQLLTDDQIERFSLEIIDTEQLVLEQARARISAFAAAQHDVARPSDYVQGLRELFTTEKVPSLLEHRKGAETQELADCLTGFHCGYDNQRQRRQHRTDLSSHSRFRPWLVALGSQRFLASCFFTDGSGVIHLIIDPKAKSTLCGQDAAALKANGSVLRRGSWHDLPSDRCKECEHQTTSPIATSGGFLAELLEEFDFPVTSGSRCRRFRSPLVRAASERLAEIAGNIDDYGEERLSEELEHLLFELEKQARDSAMATVGEIFYAKPPTARFNDLFAADRFESNRYAKPLQRMKQAVIDCYSGDEAKLSDLKWPSRQEMISQILKPSEGYATAQCQGIDQLQFKLCARLIGYVWPQAIEVYMKDHPVRLSATDRSLLQTWDNFDQARPFVDQVYSQMGQQR